MEKESISMSEEKKELTEEERKELKEKLKKQVHEMSDEELDKVAGGLISFNPLLRYLKKHEISMYQMIKDGVITPTESTRIRADHNFRLSFIDRLCGYLHCQPSDIIEYIPEDTYDSSIDELISGLTNAKDI